jgi:hypothetical protein
MPSKTTKVKAGNIKSYEQIIGGQGNQSNWRPGVISFVNEDRLPLGAVVQAKNLMMSQDGVWATRWGSNNYGAAYTGPVTGVVDCATFSTTTGKATTYIMIVDNGILKYSKDGGPWTTVTNSTTTTGSGNHFVSTNQYTTTLASTITTTTATTITVTTASALPSSNNYYITIDNEQMYVTSGAGTTTLTVKRAINGTTAATHAQYALVKSGDQVWTQMLQYQNKILVTNGVDSFGYVDLTTSPFSWVSISAVSAPTIPATTNYSPTGVPLGFGTGVTTHNTATTQNALNYYVTAVTKNGETAPAAFPTAYTIPARTNWWNTNTSTYSSNTYINLTWNAVNDSNVIGYNLYLADNSAGVAYYLDNIAQPGTYSGGATVSYTDYGDHDVNNFIIAPITDTTNAPKFNWMAISDNRLWAIGDPNNPNRLYWAGAQLQYALGFSPFVGGGWVDIKPGTADTPRWVGQFRDGKGTPMTTILLSEPSGYGSVWHCQLTIQNISNIQVTVPTLVQAMQSFGTTAPRSVVQTLQNVYYFSPGPAGFYSNGSVQTLYNVLATNEISLVIRPDCKEITYSAIPGMAGIEFDKKIFWSVPYGATQNNQIFIYDTAKQNWNPYAFDFGVNHFFKYTDNSGILRLLAIQTKPVNGNFLIEISSNFAGDNGMPFDTHLQTGLVHVSSDHIKFANIQYAYWELGSPQGQIQLAFSGTTKNAPLSNLATYSYVAGSSADNVGFSSFAFSTLAFSAVATAPLQVTTLADKKRMRVTKLLNNWEAEIHTNTLDAQYTFNQLVVKGFMIPTQDPNAWILN